MPPSPSVLDESWVLSPTEHAWVITKSRANRLGFALLLTFFRERGRFPRQSSEVEAEHLADVSQQLKIVAPESGIFWPTGRTAERLRAEIRSHFGFREATVVDAQELTIWLREHGSPKIGGEVSPLIEILEVRCRELSVEAPTLDRMERIARAVLHAYEEQFIARIYEGLSPETRTRLDALLRPTENEGLDVPMAGTHEENENGPSRNEPALLLELRGSPGRPSLVSLP